jgi:hypothetical protein
MDLEQIEKLMLLMSKHIIDVVEVDGIKIEKKIHIPKEKKKEQPKNKPVNLTDEELLLYSSRPPSVKQLRK